MSTVYASQPGIIGINDNTELMVRDKFSELEDIIEKNNNGMKELIESETEKIKNDITSELSKTNAIVDSNKNMVLMHDKNIKNYIKYMSGKFDKFSNTVIEDFDDKCHELKTDIEKTKVDINKRIDKIKNNSIIIIAICCFFIVLTLTFSIINIVKYYGLIKNYEDLSSKYQNVSIELTDIKKSQKNISEKSSVVQPVELNLTNIAAPSNLSEDKLDELISNHILSKDNYSTKKMSDIGETLVKMEKDYQVNALFCLAVASLESGYGSSSAARNRNNLFGIMQNGYPKYFNSIDECIMYWGNLIRENYINEGRITIDSIRQKYCPNSDTWTSNVTGIMKTYANYVKN